MTNDPPTFYSWVLGDWPGAEVLAIECCWPDAPDGGQDLPLFQLCPVHGRTVYWCLNAEVLYCDGGPPDYPMHRMHVVPLDDEV